MLARVVGVSVVALVAAIAGPAAAQNKRPKPKPRPRPAVVVLVLDRSGSMSGPKIEKARDAAKAARAALPKGSEIAVVAFDSKPTTVVRRQSVASAAKIDKGIDSIKAGGGTDVYPALDLARSIAQASKLRRKLVIVLSDGQAPYDGIEALALNMAKRGIAITSVGIGDADRDLLQLISSRGGGRFYFVADPKQVPNVFASEVRTVTRAP